MSKIQLFYEKTVLNSFINDSVLYAEHRHFLKKEHFSEYGFALELLDAFSAKGYPFDIEVLESKTPQKEVQKLYDIATTTPVSDVGFYIGMLKECSSKATLLQEIDRLRAKAENASSEDIVIGLESILDKKETYVHKEFKTQAQWADVYEEMPVLPKYASGVSFLDFCLGGGFELGFLCLISGDPEAGKTSLALQIINNMSLTHKAALFPFEFTMRFYLKAQKEVSKNYRNDNLYIVPDGEDLDELTNNIKMLHRKGVRAVVIDSQMRVGVSDAKREEKEESLKFTTLAKLAAKLEILVLFIVQNSKTDPDSPLGAKKGAYESFISIHVSRVPTPKDDKENQGQPFLPNRRIVEIKKNKQTGKHFKEQVAFEPRTRNFYMIHEKRDISDIPVEVVYADKETPKKPPKKPKDDNPRIEGMLPL